MINISKIFIKIDNLFKNKKILLLICLLLLSFQLCYSFLYPTHGPRGKAWLSLPDLISHEKSPLDASEGLLITKAYGLLSNYYINADGGQYLLLANNFPNYYIGNNPVILDRPFYSFLIAVIAFLPRLFFDSYATLFASAIFLNFILGFFSVVLFYYLCEKLISSRVALLSSLLLIFSPYFHFWLVQPVPNIFTIFIIVATLVLLEKYIKNPSSLKLIVFSLIIGVFMLGKMIFAMPIFILFSAFYFKRYKEGIIFLIIHLIPLIFWYLFVVTKLGIPYYINEADYGVGVWLLDAFHSPWYKTFEIFLSVLPQFVYVVIYAFLLIPVIFSIFGFKKLIFKIGHFFALNFILSFLILLFIMNLYSPRYGFFLYPIVYPSAVLGIDQIAEFFKKYKNWYSAVFYLVVFIFLIVISNADIYKIFPYG